jgi:hypothetical protein
MYLYIVHNHIYLIFMVRLRCTCAIVQIDDRFSAMHDHYHSGYITVDPFRKMHVNDKYSRMAWSTKRMYCRGLYIGPKTKSPPFPQYANIYPSCTLFAFIFCPFSVYLIFLASTVPLSFLFLPILSNFRLFLFPFSYFPPTADTPEGGEGGGWVYFLVNRILMHSLDCVSLHSGETQIFFQSWI